MVDRKTARSMTTLDERILEYLRDEEWSTPAIMADVETLDATEAQIQERCFVLTQAELVAPVVEGSDMWELTKWGVMYLDGDLDAEGQEWPDSSRRFIEALP